MILLDTHILIWDALKPELLSAKAKQAISKANQAEGMLIADISLWEIAMLIKKGRVAVDAEIDSFLQLILQANNIVVRPITPEIATLSVQLPDLVNKDPADRLIAATAISEKASLVTADRNLQLSPSIQTVW
jgi:PIN domain nuclease of toxin-antitoxin system